MEYERINQAQMGPISPTKLRLQSLVSHYRKKGKKSNSSVDSKVEEMERAKSSLLSSPLNDAAASFKSFKNARVDSSANSATDVTRCQVRNQISSSSIKSQNISKNVSYPVSAFEFHTSERTSQSSIFGSVSRNFPSKWNDAEKWVLSRQMKHANVSKKSALLKQGSHKAASSLGRVAPENVILHPKQVGVQGSDEGNNPSAEDEVEKFSFFPQISQSNPVLSVETIAKSDVSATFHDSDDQTEYEKQKKFEEPSREQNLQTEQPVGGTMQSVLMRDVGTEMTPTSSHEPSRTGTPISAETPKCSPNCLVPSASILGARSTATPNVNGGKSSERNDGALELSARELRLKTRREIAALGMKLGKRSIVSWATKVEDFPRASEKIDEAQAVKMKYEARAAAWQEAEKFKLMSRYRSEEIKIQAWEGCQRTNLEAKMRKVEIRAELRRAHAQEKMVKDLAITERRAQMKYTAAEERLNKQAARLSKKVQHILKTGRIPSSQILHCSCLF